ncbi:MAG: hypothetical protein ACREMV_08470 [Gemmatimonadales bacterium]
MRTMTARVLGVGGALACAMFLTGQTPSPDDPDFGCPDPYMRRNSMWYVLRGVGMFGDRVRLDFWPPHQLLWSPPGYNPARYAVYRPGLVDLVFAFDGSVWGAENDAAYRAHCPLVVGSNPYQMIQVVIPEDGGYLGTFTMLIGPALPDTGFCPVAPPDEEQMVALCDGPPSGGVPGGSGNPPSGGDNSPPPDGGGPPPSPGGTTGSGDESDGYPGGPDAGACANPGAHFECEDVRAPDIKASTSPNQPKNIGPVERWCRAEVRLFACGPTGRGGS